VHELSVALNLIELVTERANSAGAGRVEVVHLRLGRLAGVAADALAFSFEIASRGTPVEGARLVIEEVAVSVFCPQCEAERAVSEAEWLRCPICRSLAPDVAHGRELELTALEVRDAVPGIDQVAPGA